MDILHELLTAQSFPVNKRSIMTGEVTLGKDVVRKVSEMLKPVTLIQANALNGNLGSRIMDIVVREP
jgi:hypothetical protein